MNPNLEADPPQTELVEEVTNILDTLQALNNHLRKAESAHKKLTANKCKLEHNISVKVNSINIDANLIMNREVGISLFNSSVIFIFFEGLSPKITRKMAENS